MRVAGLIRSVNEWIAANPLPAETPQEGWGHWMVAAPAGGISAGLTASCASLLEALVSCL